MVKKDSKLLMLPFKVVGMSSSVYADGSLEATKNDVGIYI